MDELRQCSKCGEKKADWCFYKSGKGWCRQCCRRQAKGWRLANPDKYAESLIRRVKNWDPNAQVECNKCRVLKPASQFYPSHGRLCKVCHNEQARIRRGRNLDKHRAYQRAFYHKSKAAKRKWTLQRYFKMTDEEYAALVKQQGGKCAVCRREPTEQPKRQLAVDHDHITGKLRGLLCGECNRGLGLFREDIGVLMRAIDYISIHRLKSIA